MTQQDRYDVAIVGYGPVGATAANLLGLRGLRVLVLERDADIYSRARAVSTDEQVVRIWQQVGLAERLKQDMLAEKPIDFVDDKGESFLSFTPRPRGSGHPPQLFIHQPALEQVLRDGVARFPDVDVRLGHECLRIWQQDDHVELTGLASGDDRVQRFTASYVIAADGASSPIRSQLGVGFSGRTYEDRWVVIDTQVVQEWPTHDRLRFHCDPARPSVDCPTPLGHHRWEFPVLPGEDEAVLTSDRGVWQLLNEQGITEQQVTVLRAVVYSHHVRFAAKWRVGRVFLTGDAAHVMPPWIGQGMAAGVRDVSNLSWKLAAVVRGQLPESLLDSYARERQPHVRAVTAKSVLFGRVITERRPLVVAARDPLFRAAMHAPYVGAYVREARWFPDPYYADGFLSAPPAARAGLPALLAAAFRKARSAVGHLLPQPYVLAADGERVLLDETLDGWAVLQVWPDPSTAAWSDRGVPVLDLLPRGSAPRGGAIVDVDGTLTAWLRGRSAHAVAVRPDQVVYAAATATTPLAPPPVAVPAGS